VQSSRISSGLTRGESRLEIIQYETIIIDDPPLTFGCDRVNSGQLFRKIVYEKKKWRLTCFYLETLIGLELETCIFVSNFLFRQRVYI